MQITDLQIKEMAEEIRAEILDEEDGSEYPLDRVVEATRNWLMRTFKNMSDSPVWYATNSGSGYGDTSVAEFRMDLCCAYFGWAQCRDIPVPGGIYCKVHKERMEEDND